MKIFPSVLGCVLNVMLVGVLSSCGSSKSLDSTTTTTAVAIAPLATAQVAPIPVVATTTVTVAVAAPVPTTAAPTTTAAAPTTTTTAPATTTTQPAGSRLPLQRDGIGDARFGAAPEDVIAYITSVLGAPTGDSGWVPAIERLCSGNRTREVQWADLRLEFGDESNVTSGADHFFAWTLGPPSGSSYAPAGMVTTEGIGLGSTVADVQGAYPAATVFAGDDLVASSVTLSESLFAFVTSADATGAVTTLVGGQGCGE